MMKDENAERSRRWFLGRTAGAVGAGGLAALAGCSGAASNAIGGGGNYAKWLSAPDQLSDSEHYKYLYIAPKPFVKNEDELDSSLYDTLENNTGYSTTNVDFQDKSFILYFQNQGLFTGNFKKKDLVDELEDSNYEEETTHEGFSIFAPDSSGTETPGHSSRIFGVSGNAVIAGQSESAVETIIDTKKGNEDRYVEQSDDLKKVKSLLHGSPSYAYARTQEETQESKPKQGRFEEVVAVGYSLKIKGKNSTVRIPFVFQDKGDVATDEFSEWIEANDGSDQLFDDIKNVKMKQKGRAGLVTGKIATEDLTMRHLFGV